MGKTNSRAAAVRKVFIMVNKWSMKITEFSLGAVKNTGKKLHVIHIITI